MLVIIVAVMGLALGFGTGAVVFRAGKEEPDRTDRPMGSVRALMDQTRWLPIVSVTHRKRDDMGYPAPKGQMVPTMELDGGIRVIAGDRAINSAFLEYNGTRIGLSPDDRTWLGQVLKDRVAELAMSSAETKLLER